MSLKMSNSVAIKDGKVSVNTGAVNSKRKNNVFSTDVPALNKGDKATQFTATQFTAILQKNSQKNLTSGIESRLGGWPGIGFKLGSEAKGSGSKVPGCQQGGEHLAKQKKSDVDRSHVQGNKASLDGSSKKLQHKDKGDSNRKSLEANRKDLEENKALLGLQPAKDSQLDAIMVGALLATGISESEIDLATEASEEMNLVLTESLEGNVADILRSNRDLELREGGLLNKSGAAENADTENADAENADAKNSGAENADMVDREETPMLLPNDELDEWGNMGDRLMSSIASEIAMVSGLTASGNIEMASASGLEINEGREAWDMIDAGLDMSNELQPILLVEEQGMPDSAKLDVGFGAAADQMKNNQASNKFSVTNNQMIASEEMLSDFMLSDFAGKEMETVFVKDGGSRSNILGLANKLGATELRMSDIVDDKTPMDVAKLASDNLKSAMFSSSNLMFAEDGSNETSMKLMADIEQRLQHKREEYLGIVDPEGAEIALEDFEENMGQQQFSGGSNKQSHAKTASMIASFGGEVAQDAAFSEKMNVSFTQKLMEKSNFVPTRHEQISMSINHAMNAGKKEIKINLYPKALGAIDVTLELTKNLKGESVIKSIKITSENKHTHEILEKAQADLAKSLSEVKESKDASLEFAMKKDGEEAGQNNMLYSDSEEREKWMEKFEQGKTGEGEIAGEDELETGTAAGETTVQARHKVGKLNIEV